MSPVMRFLRFAALCTCGFAFGSPAQTVDEFLLGCPSATEVAAINAQIHLAFEGDPTSSNWVCTTAGGSTNLTLLQRRAYNILSFMRQVTFTAPLPWTAPPTPSLAQWLHQQSGVTRIRFRSDIDTSFCCDPANTVNIAVTANSYILLTDRWIDQQMGGGLANTLALIVHEARHNQNKPHTCGSSDSTFAELGAWATQAYALIWLSDFVDPNFLRPLDNPYDYYRDLSRNEAERIRGERICNDARQLRTLTALEYYNAPLNHYFVTAHPAEISFVDSGGAGPGWARTGQSFKVFASAAEAPMNALPVCRFYGTPGLGPNSHFYTVNPEECAAVKTDRGWTYEGIVFFALKPVVGLCPNYDQNTASQRVWRAYNQRFAQQDSNHRYTVDLTTYGQMQAAGWSAEGAVMCAAP